MLSFGETLFWETGQGFESPPYSLMPLHPMTPGVVFMIILLLETFWCLAVCRCVIHFVAEPTARVSLLQRATERHGCPANIERCSNFCLKGLASSTSLRQHASDFSTRIHEVEAGGTIRVPAQSCANSKVGCGLRPILQQVMKSQVPPTPSSSSWVWIGLIPFVGLLRTDALGCYSDCTEACTAEACNLRCF